MRSEHDAGGEDREELGSVGRLFDESAGSELASVEANSGTVDHLDSDRRVDSEADRREKPKRKRSGFAEALTLVITALVLALTLKTYVAEAYEIKGSSMLPTFHNGERVVVLKSFYDVERGDIVIFESTEDPGKDLIKRVVGLPGERVMIRSGSVFVDGVPLAERYLDVEGLDRTGMYRSNTWNLGPNEYFVLGDNRGDSHDSRRFHGVPAKNIKGKVVVRWWPLDDLESF